MGLSSGPDVDYITPTGRSYVIYRKRPWLEMIQEMMGQKIAFEFSNSPNNFHYTLTPYLFTPKIGSKLVSNLYMDMGQGLLECMQEISKELELSKAKD